MEQEMAMDMANLSMVRAGGNAPWCNGNFHSAGATVKKTAQEVSLPACKNIFELLTFAVPVHLEGSHFRSEDFPGHLTAMPFRTHDRQGREKEVRKDGVLPHLFVPQPSLFL